LPPERFGKLFIGCCLGVFGLGLLGFVLCAVIGLTTGYLFIPGRGKPMELYGTSARIVSAIILLFIAVVIYLMVRGSKKKRRPKILGDGDDP
jgi:membrane protein DedA with SNARE-associated domain